MYYLQNTKNITTVILSFDNVMTDLGKLRYNYYRRLCKLYNETLDKDIYFNQCASQSTMYQYCPIPSDLMPKSALKTKVEEDLLLYCRNHGIKIHEGFDELYQLLKTKKIDLYYTSTHAQKWTDPLFHLTGGFYRPKQFFCNDFTIYDQFKNNPSEVLVIASDIHTLKIANAYRFNVLFYPTIQESNEEIKIRSLAVIHHLIEAINLILDTTRQPRNSYIFVENGKLLNDQYHHLVDNTSNESFKEILNMIYEFETSLIDNTEAEDVIEDINNETEKIAVSKDIEPDPIEVSDIEVPSKEENQSEENAVEIPFIEDSEDLFEKTMVFDFKIDEETKTNPLDEIEIDDSFTLEPMTDEENTNTSIDSILDQLNQQQTKASFTKAELKEFGMSESDLYADGEDEDSVSLIQIIFNSLFYALVDCIIFMIIYLALSIGFHDWIFQPDGALHFIQPIIKMAHNISMSLFGSIAQMIGNTMNASTSFVEGIAVSLFITIIFWIGISIGTIIKEKRS